MVFECLSCWRVSCVVWKFLRRVGKWRNGGLLNAPSEYCLTLVLVPLARLW